MYILLNPNNMYIICIKDLISIVAPSFITLYQLLNSTRSSKRKLLYQSQMHMYIFQSNKKFNYKKLKR